jgi:hypothetical protein
MSETRWPHTLHTSLNLGNRMVRFPKPDYSVLAVTVIFQILDIPIPKLDILIFTD